MEMTSNEKALFEKAKDHLETNKVDTSKLGVVMIGNEQYLGEISDVTYSEQFSLSMHNPRRLLRLQQAKQQGRGIQYSVDFMVVDLDLIEEGDIKLFPTAYYMLDNLNEISQARILALYAQYIDDKQAARLAASGLVAPGINAPPGIGIRPRE
jgi:hypothetical protein